MNGIKVDKKAITNILNWSNSLYVFPTVCADIG